MSSHHIVRDNQEPALILLSRPHRPEVLHQLLEWSPTVVVSEECLDDILQLNIKIDVVLSSKGLSDLSKEQLSTQHPLTHIEVPDNRHILQAGISYLRSAGHRAVNLISLQPESLLDMLSATKDMDFTIFDGRVRWACYRSGNFRKWLAKGTRLILQKQKDIRIAPKVAVNDDNDYLTFLTFDDGMVEIRSSGESFWVGQHFN